ncbi:MAG TPA: septum formation initiator family protein [Clostridia bacterium]|nr:septum formation initiator family protein [Clostridia bacterium]
MAHKRRFRTTPRFVALVMLVCLVFACVVFVAQQQKLGEVRAQKAELDERYAALQAEEQRLEYMIEYAKSDEYRIQYAREKLGLVLPGDIKFDIDK